LLERDEDPERLGRDEEEIVYEIDENDESYLDEFRGQEDHENS
jgi:hypothetical protein